jgi:hypothetical protein
LNYICFIRRGIKLKLKQLALGIPLLCLLINGANAKGDWRSHLSSAVGVLNEIANQSGGVGGVLVNQYESDYGLSSVKVNADSSALAKGLFIDSTSGLTWYRCPAPSSWNGNTCNGSPIVAMRYDEAIKLVKELNSKNYGGYSDWRIPTLNESLNMIYGTSDLNAQVARVNVRGINIFKTKLGAMSSSENGCENDQLCMFGAMWTSTQKETRGQGLSFSIIDLDSTDLKGPIESRNEVAKVATGIVTGSYNNQSSSFYPLLRLVRGGQQIDSNGEKGIKTYQEEMSKKQEIYRNNLSIAEKNAEECKNTENAKWRKKIQEGDITNEGAVFKIVANQYVIQYQENGSLKYKTITNTNKLENFLINSACMKPVIDVMKNKN